MRQGAGDYDFESVVVESGDRRPKVQVCQAVIFEVGARPVYKKDLADGAHAHGRNAGMSRPLLNLVG